jgi:hypothetical protein
MLWIAAIGACLAAIVLWQLTMIAALRLFGTRLPFSIAFHIYPRRKHELLAALKRGRKNTFVFISGFLLLACPLFVGLTAYDYIVNRPDGHQAYGLNYIVGSVFAFLVMVAAGVWSSASNWNEYYSDSSPRS